LLLRTELSELRIMREVVKVCHRRSPCDGWCPQPKALRRHPHARSFGGTVRHAGLWRLCIFQIQMLNLDKSQQ